MSMQVQKGFIIIMMIYVNLMVSILSVIFIEYAFLVKRYTLAVAQDMVCKGQLELLLACGQQYCTQFLLECETQQEQLVFSGQVHYGSDTSFQGMVTIIPEADVWIIKAALYDGSGQIREMKKVVKKV